MEIGVLQQLKVSALDVQNQQETVVWVKVRYVTNDAASRDKAHIIRTNFTVQKAKNNFWLYISFN